MRAARFLRDYFLEAICFCRGAGVGCARHRCKTESAILAGWIRVVSSRAVRLFEGEFLKYAGKWVLYFGINLGVCGWFCGGRGLWEVLEGSGWLGSYDFLN